MHTRVNVKNNLSKIDNCILIGTFWCNNTNIINIYEF